MVLEPVVRPVVNPVARAIQGSMNGVFSPAILFTTGEQGAWYDPSDLTTLFQDSAGTTPVTAVEQPVGLVLDKSKGLVLGSELVTNGDGSSTTGWSTFGIVTSFASVAGAFQIQTPNSAGSEGVRQVLSGLVAGTFYKVSVSLRIVNTPVANQTASLRWANGNVTSGFTTLLATNSASTVTLSGVFSPSGTSVTIALVNGGLSLPGGGPFITEFDNISVRELPGNHAYQTTSASRPTLRARYNLLTYSEQFDIGVWTKGGGAAITPNSVVAPDGTTSADTLSLPTGGNVSQLWQATGIINGPVTASMWIRADAPITLSFGFYDSTGDVTSISVTTSWQRVTWTRAAGLTSADRRACWLYNGNAGAATVYIWGAQLTQTAVFPSNTYQRVGAATDYATGAAFPPYLFFDGVDDSLLTNSVDFSATDKMTVWAGVTKNGTTAGTIVEPGGAVGTTANTFALLTSGSVAGDYWFSISGSAPISNDKYCADSATTFNAPITNVVSVSANKAGYPVAANSVSMRVNAATPTQTYATLGDWSSNFSNNIIYIGRRTNSTLPLNGNIYSLIIRGAQSTAAQISSTESWVAAKTPLGSL